MGLKITDKNKTEILAKPENVQYPGIAIILVNDNAIEVRYVKNSDFISIVKKLRYRWSGTVWCHDINEFTGSAIDREAELGNELLNAGFCVEFATEEGRNKALEGVYEKENIRWIKWNPQEEKLAIRWERNNDKLYRAAKKLPGAKYRSGAILVSPEFFNEISDFAQIYDFQFSKAARNEIDKTINKMESIPTVNVAQHKEKRLDDSDEKLKSMLLKNGIIEDLVDDDEA